MNNHIDQLTEWWENAEHGAIRKGDTVIIKSKDAYLVETSNSDAPNPIDAVRILTRAPKPKPAWHNAAYVLAYAPNDTTDYGEGRPVYYRNADGTFSDYEDRGRWNPDELRDVTPLIEAKVTDEMVERAAQSLEDAGWDTSDGDAALTDALAAALGLETK